MQISPQTDKLLHQQLPIDKDEKVLAVYKHHWFAYVTVWFVGLVAAVMVVGLASLLTAGDEMAQYRQLAMAVAGLFALIVLFGAAIPVYLRTQEHLVLTDEALLQTLQPTIFAGKTNQLSLHHIADVAVTEDFFGTIFGYGRIVIETPGEQANYEFYALPNPKQAAREIMEAHENFNAALMAGRMPTTLQKQTVQPHEIDQAEYEQFLAYKRMAAKQSQDAQSGVPKDPNV